MAIRERRKSPRGTIGRRGPSLRREVQQLKQRSEEILLRMDELLRELESIEAKTLIVNPKK